MAPEARVRFERFIALNVRRIIFHTSTEVTTGSSKFNIGLKWLKAHLLSLGRRAENV